MKRLYSSLRKRLNPIQKGKLSKLAFTLSNRLVPKKDNIDSCKKYPNGEKGGLIISADFEMAWAWRYTKTGADFIEKGHIERMNFPQIINLLEKYNVPITFATVGHLFLDNCKRGDHDWMKRIPHFNDHWRFTEGDWYDHDPYDSYKNAPEWYGLDLIQRLQGSTVKHEIGTHTFSHIDFSYKNCPAKVADDEIRACCDAASKLGINLKSMVFPGGTWEI